MEQEGGKNELVGSEKCDRELGETRRSAQLVRGFGTPCRWSTTSESVRVDGGLHRNIRQLSQIRVVSFSLALVRTHQFLRVSWDGYRFWVTSEPSEDRQRYDKISPGPSERVSTDPGRTCRRANAEQSETGH